MFRSLKSKDYRTFFCGQSLSMVGNWMQRMAASWLVYRLSGSPILLGLAGFADTIAAFVLSPFAGALVDRWNRRKALLILQSLLFLLCAVLTVLTLTDYVTVEWIIGLNVLTGIVYSFEIPTRQSMIIELIDDRKDIGNAIALNSSALNFARIGGPFLAGIMTAYWGEESCFLFNTLSYIPVIFALFLIRKEHEGKRVHAKLWSQVCEGVQYAYTSPPIRSVLTIVGLTCLFGIGYQTMMPVMAREVLNGDSRVQGILMGSVGVGALIGSLWLAARTKAESPWGTIAFAGAVFSASLMLFAMTGSLWSACLAGAGIGFGNMTQMASCNTCLQTFVIEDKRGRVMALYTMAFLGTTTFGNLLAGSATKYFGVRATIFVGGLICVFVTLQYYLQGDYRVARNLKI